MSEAARKLHPSESALDRIAESFERALLREEFSPATVRNYGIGVKNLFSFLRDRGVWDFADLTRGLLEEWQDSLRERTPPLKANSRALYATAVRQLIEWAADRDVVDVKLVRAIARVRTRRREQDQRQPIPASDLAQLMAYLGQRRRRMTIIDLRDRALFFFLLETGLRVSEALQVTRAGYIGGRVRQKGGTWIEFAITATVAEMIADYNRVRRDESPWQWVKHGNNAAVEGRLADSGVREIWRRLCAQLGIPRFTTHQLRHTSASLIHEKQLGDELVIAAHLHHADTRTAHRYVKVSDSRKQQVLDGLETLIRRGAGMSEPRIPPELLGRRSPPGGRPRYR